MRKKAEAPTSSLGSRSKKKQRDDLRGAARVRTMTEIHTYFDYYSTIYAPCMNIKCWTRLGYLLLLTFLEDSKHVLSSF